MQRIHFGLIGGGWRAEFYLRIAQALPERFGVTGVAVRNAEKRAAFGRAWGVPAVDSPGALLAAAQPPAFVVVCVPSAFAAELIQACVARAVPVLCETPPAPDLAGLIRLHALTGRGARLQVAEQYSFQPLHAARLQVIASGRLGRVSQAQVSVAHGYHGIHLMRRFLGIDFQPVTIEARPFVAPLVRGPGRDGPPVVAAVDKDEQLFARFDFADGALGMFDFTGAQYFSPIRANRVLVRGERGELSDTEVRWLSDSGTPRMESLRRHDAGQIGNLEGFHHKGYTLGGEWIYKNPFVPGRLSDEEVAIAECLQRMAVYAGGGPSFCDLRQAAQDQYLSLLMEQSAATGRPVVSEHQPWM